MATGGLVLLGPARRHAPLASRQVPAWSASWIAERFAEGTSANACRCEDDMARLVVK